MLFCNAINLQIFQIRQIFKSEFFGRAPRNTRVGLSARHPQSHHLLARICNPCSLSGHELQSAPAVGGGFVADRECLYPSRSATRTCCGLWQQHRLLQS